MNRPAARVKDYVTKHYRKVIYAAVVLFLLSLLFRVNFGSLIVMALFVLVGSFSTFYFNFARIPVYFETVKLGTVLVAVAYGIYPGIIVGLVSTFFGKVLVGRIDEKLPLSMAAITLLAICAGVFAGANIATLGIILVLCYNLVMFLLTMALGGQLAWNLPYEGTNLLFNIFLFLKVAPFLLQVMK